MNSNENNLTLAQLEDEFDKIRRNVYLESPELWIEICDKISDGKFDEMLLFFATKYDSLPILIYATQNNLVDLDSASKNKAYSSIKQHLLSVSDQNSSKEIYKFLNGDIDSSAEETSLNKSTPTNVETESIYIPEFLCNKCNSNIFETGYIVCEKNVYKYSTGKSKILKISTDISNDITCCNCNSVIENVSASKLEQLCEIQNCNKCGLDLTQTGIIDKVKMTYDKDTKKFTSKSTSYHCSKCDNLITDKQKDYFEL